MKKQLLILFLVLCYVLSFSTVAYAGDAYITAYAFTDIAGTIKGDVIDVYVPYSTTTTYWNHKVDVSEGATFTSGSIEVLNDKHSRGVIHVVSDDRETTRDYTVNIYKRDYVEPTYSIEKAKSIKKASAKIDVHVNKNDAVIKVSRIVFYTKKNSLNYMAFDVNNGADQTIELSGLQSDTKYYYYLEIETEDKTFTTTSKNFRTAKDTDQGTSSSSSSGSTSSSSGSSKTTSSSSSGTSSTGPNTEALQDETKRNEWSYENEKWYYYGEDGFTKVGWFQVDGAWYYVTKGTNELAVNCRKEIGGVDYYFDASGAMLANQWLNLDGKWYWTSSSGSILYGQDIEVGGVIYRLAPTGECLSDVWVIKDGKWQYFKKESKGLARDEIFEYEGVVHTADKDGFVL